jgi:DNA polymerase alpha subunit A
MMDDAERFKECEKLKVTCSACRKEIDFSGLLNDVTGGSGLNCQSCGAIFFGRGKASDIFCYLSNKVTLLVRDCVRKYYDCWLICDDHSCRRRTRQQNASGYACTDDCHGRMEQEYDETLLYNQLKYLESLFDLNRSIDKRNKLAVSDPTITTTALTKIPPDDQEVFRLLKEHMSNTVTGSAYNWVMPSLWSFIFGKENKTKMLNGKSK